LTAVGSVDRNAFLEHLVGDRETLVHNRHGNGDGPPHPAVNVRRERSV
jgi:hypothetical protein